MDSVNAVVTGVFNVLMSLLGWGGDNFVQIVVAAISGVGGLILFKYISWQKGIKAVKDRIKGHLIAIRIYQDDLVLVAKGVASILLRNVQYIALNFGPFLPLFAPFALVLAQLVVRFGFLPVPVQPDGYVPLSGAATMIEIELAEPDGAQGMEVVLPEGLVALTPLFRAPGAGTAQIEVYAVAPVRGDIELRFPSGEVVTKAIVAGDEPTAMMQPERVSGFWASWLWPAEPTLPADSPVTHIKFEYPLRPAILMEGPIGLILVFFVFSMLAGIALIKPLHIQI